MSGFPLAILTSFWNLKRALLQEGSGSETIPIKTITSRESGRERDREREREREISRERERERERES